MNYVSISVVCISSLVLAACTTAPVTSAPTAPAASAAKPAAAKPSNAAVEFPVEVEKRAKLRWDLLMQGKADASYSLLTSSSREAVTLEQYRPLRTQRWTGVQVTGKKCEADSCEVDIELTYDINKDLTGLKRALKETWLKAADGNWFYVFARRTGAN
jgi:hypothetical protein